MKNLQINVASLSQITDPGGTAIGHVPSVSGILDVGEGLIART